MFFSVDPKQRYCYVTYYRFSWTNSKFANMFSTHVQPPHCNTYAEAQNLDLNDKFIKVSIKAENKKHYRRLIYSIQMSNRPTTSMPLNESELVNQCRRFLVNGKLQSPMDHIRMLCLARGTSGIYNLGR